VKEQKHMTIEAMKQALEALENNKRTHHYCEDSWYSCPKHEEGCANDSEGDECNCGADKANAEIDAAIASLRQAIQEEALRNVARLGQEIEQEPVCQYPRCSCNSKDWCDPARQQALDKKATPQPQKHQDEFKCPYCYDDPQPQRCINCESLEQQNTWLDQKLAEFEKREWVGLTDEQIESLWDHGMYVHCSGITALRAITRAIEAKLKEKNT
jgi:hypothetical protein